MIFSVAAAAILITIGLALVRALLGPTVYDRILAVNMIGTKTVLLIAVFAFLSGRTDILDIRKGVRQGGMRRGVCGFGDRGHFRLCFGIDRIQDIIGQAEPAQLVGGQAQRIALPLCFRIILVAIRGSIDRGMAFQAIGAGAEEHRPRAAADARYKVADKAVHGGDVLDGARARQVRHERTLPPPPQEVRRNDLREFLAHIASAVRDEREPIGVRIDDQAQVGFVLRHRRDGQRDGDRTSGAVRFVVRHLSLPGSDPVCGDLTHLSPRVRGAGHGEPKR